MDKEKRRTSDQFKGMHIDEEITYDEIYEEPTVVDNSLKVKIKVNQILDLLKSDYKSFEYSVLEGADLLVGDLIHIRFATGNSKSKRLLDVYMLVKSILKSNINADIKVVNDDGSIEDYSTGLINLPLYKGGQRNVVLPKINIGKISYLLKEGNIREINIHKNKEEVTQMFIFKKKLLSLIGK